MSKDDPHFRLRVPEELKSRVAEAAAVNKRSINAEIVARLEQSFQSDAVPPDLDALITEAVNKAVSRAIYGTDTPPPVSPLVDALMNNKIMAGQKGED